MDNSILQSIKDQIDKSDQIGILVGKNPKLDEMAAALSLYLSLQEQNKKVAIACPSEPVVEISSLVGIDKVKTNLEGDGGDLIVSFPYKDDEIQKVSYTLENSFLNIIVKAGEAGLSFDEKQVTFRRGGNKPALVFIIGTPRLSDLGHLFNAEELKDTTVVNIDNKVHNQGFGDVVFVSPTFSSVSEQIAQLFLFLDTNIDIDIAQNLLSGIHFATHNFQDQKTSYFAFEVAAYLMKKGAIRPKALSVRDEISDYDSMFQSSKTPNPSMNFPKQGKPKLDYQRPPDQKTGQNQFPPKQHQQSFPKQSTQSQQNSTQSQTLNQPIKQQTRGGDKEEDQEAPSDWLTPKVYKSSNLES